MRIWKRPCCFLQGWQRGLMERVEGRRGDGRRRGAVDLWGPETAAPWIHEHRRWACKPWIQKEEGGSTRYFGAQPHKNWHQLYNGRIGFVSQWISRKSSVCWFTDDLFLFSSSVPSNSPNILGGTSYRQLRFDHCTCPQSPWSFCHRTRHPRVPAAHGFTHKTVQDDNWHRK